VHKSAKYFNRQYEYTRQSTTPNIIARKIYLKRKGNKTRNLCEPNLFLTLVQINKNIFVNTRTSCYLKSIIQ